jgi:hypothetical protein
LDVRGNATFTVFDSGTPIGAFLMTDTTGGTDPGFSTLPFGNALLVDFGATTGTVAETTLDLNNPVFAGSLLFLSGSTSAPGGADPGLQALFDDNPVVLVFQLTSATPSDGLVIAQWNLVGLGPESSVPEPTTGVLVLAGVGLLVGIQRGTRSERMKTGCR